MIGHHASARRTWALSLCGDSLDIGEWGNRCLGTDSGSDEPTARQPIVDLVVLAEAFQSHLSLQRHTTTTTALKLFSKEK